MRKQAKPKQGQPTAWNSEQKARAVGYLRCSTEDQTRGEYNTLESQRDIITAFIAANHPEWELRGFYEDAGFSGKNTRRPGLQHLLLDAEEGVFDVVVTYKLDRITRSLADFVQLDARFEHYGVSFVAVKDQFDTSHPMGKAMRNIAMTFAELEREMTAERTRDKMIALAKQGRWPGGVPPFGYNVCNSGLVPDEKEAPTVRLIFQEYLRSRSLAAIREKLVALEIMPSNWSTKTDPDKPALRYWSKQKLSYILQNRIYLGEINYSGLRFEGLHPALIDPETFELAQNLFAEHSHRPEMNVDYDFLLAGKVYCDHCGCRMSPKATRHPNRKKNFTAYYECYRIGRYLGIECDVRRINGELLDGLFMEIVGELSADEEALARAAQESIDELDASTASLRQEIDKLRHRRADVADKLDKVYEAIEKGLVSSGLQGRLTKLESDLRQLEHELADSQVRLREASPVPLDLAEARELFGQLNEILGFCTAEERGLLVDALVKRITVRKDNTVLFELYAGSDEHRVAQSVKDGCRTRTRT